MPQFCHGSSNLGLDLVGACFKTNAAILSATLGVTHSTIIPGAHILDVKA
jgi:hypothetical protein